VFETLPSITSLAFFVFFRHRDFQQKDLYTEGDLPGMPAWFSMMMEIKVSTRDAQLTQRSAEQQKNDKVISHCFMVFLIP
jgi:hypothetical protein